MTKFTICNWSYNYINTTSTQTRPFPENRLYIWSLYQCLGIVCKVPNCTHPVKPGLSLFVLGTRFFSSHWICMNNKNMKPLHMHSIHTPHGRRKQNSHQRWIERHQSISANNVSTLLSFNINIIHFLLLVIVPLMSFTDRKYWLMRTYFLLCGIPN